MSHRPEWCRVITDAVLLLGAALVVSPAWAAPPTFVEVCHSPPGKPDRFHTVTIPENLLSTHLAHGDLAGACDALCAELCDDGDACTVDDTGDCEQQGCPTVPEPVNCDDGLACSADSCDSSTGCQNVPVVCTPSDLCHASACAEPEGVCLETQVICPAGDSCNLGTGLCCPGGVCPVNCPCFDEADIDAAEATFGEGTAFFQDPSQFLICSGGDPAFFFASKETQERRCIRNVAGELNNFNGLSEEEAQRCTEVIDSACGS